MILLNKSTYNYFYELTNWFKMHILEDAKRNSFQNVAL